MFIITIIHLSICFLLIVIVLLQQGRGADAGVTFGGGGGTVFGAAGADNLLTRVTTILALCFMATSVILSAGGNKWARSEGSLFQDFKEAAPADMANDPEARQADPAPTTDAAQGTAPATNTPAAPPPLEPVAPQ